MFAALLKAIRITSSRRNLVKAIGTTPDAINAWLNRGVRIPLEYAIEIERVTNGEVTWQEVAPHLAHFGKRWSVAFISNIHVPIQSLHVAVSRIKHPFHSFALTQSLYDLSEDIKCNGLQNPICVDADNCLVFGEKRLHAYEILHKKTIPAWRLSLFDLINGKYRSDELCHIFSLSERIAISLAVENLLGKRQGQRNNHPPRQNFVEVKGRTDDFIANLLCFGNRQSYQHAKKVFQFGSPELINAIDQGHIAISTAAILVPLPYDQQKLILTKSNKEISASVNRLRKQGQIYSFNENLLLEESV